MDKILDLNILKENFPIKMGIPFVFRFRPPNAYTLSELEESFIWFSDRDSLNDSFDSNPEFVTLSKDPDEIKLLYDKIGSGILDKQTKRYFDKNISPEGLLEFAQTKVAPFVNSFGIACFSMYPMNSKLWEIYSKNCTGVCLQFDTSVDKTFFHNVLPIIYVDRIKNREYNPLSEPNHIVDLFYKKTKDWEYEKELRLIKDRTGKIQFDSKSLKSIILGYKVNEDFSDAIIALRNKLYKEIPIYKTIGLPSLDNFKCKLI